ncbi:MAG: hypothetical protein ACKVT1_20760 [Dehalococcoidia bacterium]
MTDDGKLTRPKDDVVIPKSPSQRPIGDSKIDTVSLRLVPDFHDPAESSLWIDQSFNNVAGNGLRRPDGIIGLWAVVALTHV